MIVANHTATSCFRYPFLDRTISFGMTKTNFSEFALDENETEALDDGQFRLCVRAAPNYTATVSIVEDGSVASQAK